MPHENSLNELRQIVRDKMGGKLPGERELTAMLKVSRPRLRMMLDVLEREGIVERRQGSGTFAIEPNSRGLRRVLLLADSALKLGDDPFFSRVVEGVQAELQLGDIQCMLVRIKDEPPFLPRYDGLIALGHSALNMLQDPGLAAAPAVGLFAPAEAKPGNAVSVLGLDDYAAGVKAAQRLLESGVTSIYFLGRQSVPAVQQRCAGAKSAIEAAGGRLEIIDCGLNFSAGLEQGLKFPAGLTPVGVIAANDWLATGFRTGQRSAPGYTPQYTPVVSFDALNITAPIQLQIESLAVPLDTMITDAVEELTRLQKPRATGRVIRYELDWRKA